MHGQRGGTVVLIGMVWLCQIGGCYGLGCLLGTVGRGFVFGVMADSKIYALALIMHGKEWGKVKGSVEWEKNEEERKQVYKVSSRFRGTRKQTLRT